MGSSGDRLPAAVVSSTPSGIVVRFISDGGDEAGLTIDIVSDFHEAVIREQHMVGAFNTVVLGTLLLAVVVSVFLVVHLPLEVVIPGCILLLLLLYWLELFAASVVLRQS